MQIGRPSWRLLGLGVTLAAVLYLCGLLAALDYRNDLGTWASMAALLAGVALLLVVLALAVAAVQHDLRSVGALLLFSHAASLCAAAALFVALEVTLYSAGRTSLYGPLSLATEAPTGFWVTLVLLLGLVLFTAVHSQGRSQVDSLIAIPVFAWGLDATRGQWLAFTSSSDDLAFYVHMHWLGITVATLVLLGILAAVCAWRHWCGRRVVRLAVLAPMALTILVVYADWAFNFSVLSMFLVDARPAT